MLILDSEFWGNKFLGGILYGFSDFFCDFGDFWGEFGILGGGIPPPPPKIPGYNTGRGYTRLYAVWPPPKTKSRVNNTLSDYLSLMRIFQKLAPCMKDYYTTTASASHVIVQWQVPLKLMDFTRAKSRTRQQARLEVYYRLSFTSALQSTI